MRAGALAAALCTGAMAAPRRDPPTPPPRPPELTPAPPVPTPPPRPDDLAPEPSPPETPAAAPDADAGGQDSCRLALASGKMEAVAVPPVLGPGRCGIAAPLRLSGVILSDGRHVPVEPPALMRCGLGIVIADWARDDIAPAMEKSGERLTKILDADSYSCRGRNRIAGAKLSEHASGNAFDLRGLATASGRTYLVEKQSEFPGVTRELKRTACLRFTTVLGPGSDPFHSTHAHVDLAQRRGGYRMCQWEAP